VNPAGEISRTQASCGRAVEDSSTPQDEAPQDKAHAGRCPHIFTSSHPLIISSSHLHIISSSHPPLHINNILTLLDKSKYFMFLCHPMNYWLLKSEPVKYSWDQLLKDKRTVWDGVRNYQARNNLKEMKKGDLCLFYHSNEGKEVRGIAKVVKTFYQDPTSDDPNWVSVDIAPFKTLKKPVNLEQMKADNRLSQIGLIRQGRLSVMKLTVAEFDTLLELSETK
jgi:predicted RNA-binding protein with PUA-like domain